MQWKIYIPPVTVAEIKKGYHWELYNVSIINDFNLPMTIEATDWRDYYCNNRGCLDDLNQGCSKEQLEGRGSCNTACQPYYSSCVNPSGYIVRFCSPSDTFSTIKLGSKLLTSDTLVSVGGNFTLGFFGEDYNYLGIWYTNDLESRKVWVANRNMPINFTSDAHILYIYPSTRNTHALSIDPSTGNLIITNGITTLMGITDFDAGPNPNVTATLEDNGNFLLINNKDKRILWQSFDHPTDVLLPGMKLGYDLTTGQSLTLTSWLSDEIPHKGAFTLSWEPIDEASQ